VIDFVDDRRATGSSTWSLRSLVDYGVEGVLAFNIKPLRLLVYTGLTVMALSSAYIAFVVFRTGGRRASTRRATRRSSPRSWASVACSSSGSGSSASTSGASTSRPSAGRTSSSARRTSARRRGPRADRTRTQLARFAVFGLVNTATYYVLFWLLLRGCPTSRRTCSRGSPA
jgi:hypothetical protein